MIISASRRTDIPAFYSEWFENRIDAGYLLVRNPRNAHQIKEVSLKPDDVDVIVFWTRNSRNTYPVLKKLDAIGIKYYFQYTITGYPRIFEKSVPSPHQAIRDFSKLSDTIGSGRVVWRYDPILLSNTLHFDEHKRLFSKIASSLEGKTKRVVISFADFYKKTERGLLKVKGETFIDITRATDLMLELTRFMSDEAKARGMRITSCAEHVDLSSVGIGHGKCIDENIIFEEFGIQLSPKKDTGQREACGCIKSIDIGEYNTCLHGCTYCYATFSDNSVESNRKKHDPSSPFLLGQPSPDIYHPIHIIRKQETLF